MQSKKAPVAIFFFRREHVYEVFKQVRLYKPSRLYLVSDGGRTTEEHNICIDIRLKIEAMINWNCEIIKIYKDSNVGVDIIIPRTITYIFETEEELIILEDDCVPDLSFFIYTEALLEKYKNHDKFMNICGTNWFDDLTFDLNSYFYSNNFEGFGWATWRRAWRIYDDQMRAFCPRKTMDILYDLYDNTLIVKGYHALFNDHYKIAQKKDWKNSHWDGKWLYACMMNQGISIIPNKNLVTNIGFDSLATHTTNRNSFMANKPKQKMHFPLKHNDQLVANHHYDNLYARKILGFSYTKYFINTLKKFLRWIFKL